MKGEPAYRIVINVLSACAPVKKSVLMKVVKTALARHRIATANISLALVDDAEIARLNEKYLGHRGATDVLTYDYSRVPRQGALRSRTSRISESRDLEGEIVISAETALREANRREHEVTPELALYALHGVLHLIGFDDSGAAAAARMHEEEDAILAMLGFGAIYGATSR